MTTARKDECSCLLHHKLLATEISDRGFQSLDSDIQVRDDGMLGRAIVVVTPHDLEEQSGTSGCRCGLMMVVKK